MMRHNRLLAILAAVLVLFNLLTAVVPAHAATLEQKQKEKEAIERQLGRQQGNLKQQRQDEAALKGELSRLDQRMQELQADLARINGEIAAAEREIARVEADLTAAEEELAFKDDLLKRRLRAIYEQGYVSYLDVLLGANSFSDFLTRFNSLRIIASNDQRLVEEVRAERDRIEALKEELEERKNKLEGMRRRILDNQAEVSRIVSTRETVLKDLQDKVASNIKAIKDLEQESQRLENEIQALMRAGRDSGGGGIGGKLCYPIEPTTWISSGFGWRRDPFTGATSWHGGVDIATYGRPNYILAAEKGKVIMAGWNGGYGNCIIIDHGGGTATLYGHLSSYLVSVGQSVSRGQRIARAGTTGNSTGVHLHFEVREYNKPPYRYYPGGAPDYRYNPMSYF